MAKLRDNSGTTPGQNSGTDQQKSDFHKINYDSHTLSHKNVGVILKNESTKMYQVTLWFLFLITSLSITLLAFHLSFFDFIKKVNKKTQTYKEIKRKGASYFFSFSHCPTCLSSVLFFDLIKKKVNKKNLGQVKKRKKEK